MTLPPSNPRLAPSAAPLSASSEPKIVLTWMIRLRWIAVAGQIAATAFAIFALGARAPLPPIAVAIVTTVLTNLALAGWLRGRDHGSPLLIPAILLLDIGLLTSLLFFTGGHNNPFAVLYLVHVAMAVVVLGPPWAWFIVVMAALSYGFLFIAHVPLDLPPDRAGPILSAGAWLSLVLVAVLVTYFIDRVMGALRERERELSTMRARAARNEQLAALTTLSAGAAHELGTPLGTIAVVAKEIELAAAAPNLPNGSHIADDAQLIRAEVDRCRAILQRMRVDILDDTPQKPEPTNLADLVAQLRREFKPAQADRLRVNLPPDGPAAATLPVRAVLQSLLVLVRNAFDASDDAAPVTLTITCPTGRVRFDVRDTGHGMSDETLRRAGQPFYTTKPPGRGMGLGLFLVRLVAERYDGAFHLHSTPNAGTTSTLELPNASRPHP